MISIHPLGASTGGQRTIFLEFVATNMVGGTIEVFDGTNSTGTLLWQCISCSILARPIVSTSSALFVRYTTTTGGTTPKGTGFTAAYWTVTKNVNDWRTKTNGTYSLLFCFCQYSNRHTTTLSYA